MRTDGNQHDCGSMWGKDDLRDIGVARPVVGRNVELLSWHFPAISLVTALKR